LAESVDVDMLENDIELIEMKARGQSGNKNWFLFKQAG
jgi:hypothetical protein